MHAAALGERVAEVARRATDAVLRQVRLIIIVKMIRTMMMVRTMMKMMMKMMIKTDLNSFSLGVRVVLLLPPGKVRAGDSLVLIIKR